eukprot:gene8339-biopygen10640
MKKYTEVTLFSHPWRALRRRGNCGTARTLLRGWARDGRLLDWVTRIGTSGSGPNDAAIIQRAIAHRDARDTLEERAAWVRWCTFGSQPTGNGLRNLQGGGRLRGRGQEGTVCRVTVHPSPGHTVAGEPVLHARMR